MQLLSILTSKYESAQRASEEARAGAAHDDALAKSKYDTQATELSYLADGQAQRATAFANEMAYLERLSLQDFEEDDPIDVTCLVLLESPKPCWYLLLNAAAGTTVNIAGQDVTILNPQSPLGQKLVGLYVGDCLHDNRQVMVKAVF